MLSYVSFLYFYTTFYRVSGWMIISMNGLWVKPHVGYECVSCGWEFLTVHLSSSSTLCENVLLYVKCERENSWLMSRHQYQNKTVSIRDNSKVMWKIIQWCSNTVAKTKELKEHRNPTQAQDLWMKHLGNSHNVNRVVNTPPRGRSQ